MKLHRDLDISYPSAWFMLHRIREAFADVAASFDGPVEVDETLVGGLERNKHESKKLKAGRGPVGKTTVVGMKDRATNQVVAKVIEHTDRETLQGFVDDHASPDATLYTDDATAYRGPGGSTKRSSTPRANTSGISKERPSTPTGWSRCG